MSSPSLSAAQYYAQRPKSLNAAGVIYHSSCGSILLVQPTYRSDTFEIPGGALEHGEYPLHGARREIKEELGWDRPIGRLLAVDWVPENGDRPALANYLFDGGPVSDDDLRQHLHLDTNELATWRLASPADWNHLLIPHMARRVHACATALTLHTTAYLHHGHAPETTD